MDLQSLSNLEIFMVSALILLVPTLYMVLPFEKISRVVPIRLWIWTAIGTIAVPVGQIAILANLESFQAAQVGAALGSVLTSLWIFTVATTLRRILSAALDHQVETEKIAKRLAHILNIALKYVVLILALLMILEQWGFDPVAVITGLGVLSLGIALASQSTVANVFGFANISVTHPFFEGDKITTAGISGTVEKINIGQTTVRQRNGDLIIVPNRHLSDAIVTNHSMKQKHSESVTVTLSPETTHEKVQELIHKVCQSDFLHTYDGAVVIRASLDSIGDKVQVTFYYEMAHELNLESHELGKTATLMAVMRNMKELDIELSGIRSEEIILSGECEQCAPSDDSPAGDETIQVAKKENESASEVTDEETG